MLKQQRARTEVFTTWLFSAQLSLHHCRTLPCSFQRPWRTGSSRSMVLVSQCTPTACFKPFTVAGCSQTPIHTTRITRRTIRRQAATASSCRTVFYSLPHSRRLHPLWMKDQDDNDWLDDLLDKPIIKVDEEESVWKSMYDENPQKFETIYVTVAISLCWILAIYSFHIWKDTYYSSKDSSLF